MAKRALPTQDPFIQSVEAALEHARDPQWLGANSPLAAPYVLGTLLDGYPDNETPVGRGHALVDCFHKAAQGLTPDQQTLLQVAFFQRDPHLNNSGLAMKLGYSPATYYRYRTAAIEALAQRFSQQVLPPLRLEMPPRVALIGRTALLARCQQALRSGQSVALLGPSGIGKTTLGRALVEQWGVAHAFWFTIRPGFNDQLGSFIFALGYCLRGLGAANTWRQLVADQGVLNLEQSLGLLRYDLAQLDGQPILLCVDEVDQLQPAKGDHVQLLHLLAELRTLTALLVISQQPLIEVQQIYTLTGFSADELDACLTYHGAQATAPTPLRLVPHEQGQLLQATRGNPALITLFIHLWQWGGNVAAALAELRAAPALELLLNRLWQRLDQEERFLLPALAIFRTFAPEDAWQAQGATLTRLKARTLVEADGAGGIAVVPYLRTLLLDRLSADQKVGLHLAAAEIYASRSDYTAAADHYLDARQPALALWLWFHHRQQEVEKGRAATALALFQRVAFSDLPTDDDRRVLGLVRAELYKLVGATANALADLDANGWPATHPASAYAHQLQGDLLEMQEGRLAQALAHYRQGFQLLNQATHQRAVELLTRQGYIYLYRLRDLKQARQEALLARLKAEDFLGNVEEEAGNYALARTHYTAALAVATQVEHNRQHLARIHSNLGRLTWRQGDAPTAILHLQEAIQLEETRGNSVGLLHDRVNLAGAYIIAGRYGAALEQALAGLRVAEELRHAYLVAGLAASACEACYYLKRFDEAERYADQSLQQEEEAQRPYPLTILALIHHERGQFEHATRTFQAAIESAQIAKDKYAEAAAWHAFGRTLRTAPPAAVSPHDALRKARQLYTELELFQEVANVDALLLEQ